MNQIHFKMVMDAIKANPASWNQGTYHCKTAHCFAGHAELLLGQSDPTRTVEIANRVDRIIQLVDEDRRLSTHELDELDMLIGDTIWCAIEFLEITSPESGWLFAPHRTFEDFADALKNGIY